MSLPQDMQRSMAAEAEADREAKAKVRGLGDHHHPIPDVVRVGQIKTTGGVGWGVGYVVITLEVINTLHHA